MRASQVAVHRRIPQTAFFRLLHTSLPGKVVNVRSNIVCDGSNENNDSYSSTLCLSLWISEASAGP